MNSFLLELFGLELSELLDEIQIAIRSYPLFMQDGAFLRFSLVGKYLPNGTFPNRKTGREGRIARPANSPDWNPVDYFLGSFTKYCECHTNTLTRCTPQQYKPRLPIEV